MKVTAVTPPDAASSPSHPDHDRWVKEHTLKMEIEHAQRVGLTLRHAEDENNRLLARAEQRAKDSALIAKPRTDAATARDQRHRSRGITRKAPSKRKQKPECMCGTCTSCRRKMRVAAIFNRRKAGDPSAKAFGDELFAAFMSASTGIGAYKRLRPQDAKRALAAKIDSICDRTVPTMGQWR